MRDTVDKYCDPYVPMNAGVMKDHKTYPNNHSIKYMEPYSHYMYKGKLMVASDGQCIAKFGEKKHYTGKSLKYQGAPKRGAEWDKRMMNDRKKDLIKDVQNFINNGGR